MPATFKVRHRTRSHAPSAPAWKRLPGIDGLHYKYMPPGSPVDCFTVERDVFGAWRWVAWDRQDKIIASRDDFKSGLAARRAADAWDGKPTPVNPP